jgi:hypothetical protein
MAVCQIAPLALEGRREGSYALITIFSEFSAFALYVS